MEELRSTEILDREIQEDARKKAEKILKTADAEIEAIKAQVPARLAVLVSEKEAEYALKIEAVKRDSQAAIPLEKQRLVVSFIDEQVTEAVDNWFSNLSQDKKLELLGNHALKYNEVLKDKDVDFYYYGYTEAQIKKMCSSLFKTTNIHSCKKLQKNEALLLGFSDGFYIKTVDKSIVCRASIEEVSSVLLTEKREELALKLFGGRLPL